MDVNGVGIDCLSDEEKIELSGDILDCNDDEVYVLNITDVNNLSDDDVEKIYDYITYSTTHSNILQNKVVLDSNINIVDTSNDEINILNRAYINIDSLSNNEILALMMRLLIINI